MCFSYGNGLGTESVSTRRRAVLDAELAERRERVAADEEARRDAREGFEAVEEVLAERFGRRHQAHREAPAIPRRVDAFEGRDGILGALEGESQRAGGAAQLDGVARDRARRLLGIDAASSISRATSSMRSAAISAQCAGASKLGPAISGTCTSPNSLASASSERPSATSSCCTPRRQASASFRSARRFAAGSMPSPPSRRAAAPSRA